VCGRGVMKYKQTAHSQPAVFVGWWNGDDEFLEGNIHSTDGRYCIAADGDEVPNSSTTPQASCYCQLYLPTDPCFRVCCSALDTVPSRMSTADLCRPQPS